MQRPQDALCIRVAELTAVAGRVHVVLVEESVADVVHARLDVGTLLPNAAAAAATR